jgi:YafQ family addiction module toxin component
MTYNLEINDHLYKIFKKMEKKDRQTLGIINRKLKEILEDPHRYKPLRAPMQHMRRVHVAGSFVLIFSINESGKTVILRDFAHHDEAYY